MSLRERKKLRTRNAILSNARFLLNHKDYESITMEEIAESAEIAVGTLYNYFTSKSDLLLALIVESDDQYLMQAEEIIDSEGALEIRLTDLMLLATDHCVRHLDRSAWRHISAATLSNTNVEMGRTYSETSRNHLNLVVRMMREASLSGCLKPGVSPDDAAFAIFSMKSKMFLDFISDETMSIETHRAMILQGVRFFLQGIQNENKPVAATS